MKKYITIAALAFASCAGSDEKKNSNGEYCFLLTEGSASQDSTTVHLIINADKVSGEMNWLPSEKDSRKGILSGTIAGDEIKAAWSFMQEGVRDSIPVAFKLSSQQLAQKPLKTDGATGRQETDDSAGYMVLYKPVACK
jgi:hypothetical protein